MDLDLLGLITEFNFAYRFLILYYAEYLFCIQCSFLFKKKFLNKRLILAIFFSQFSGILNCFLSVFDINSKKEIDQF